MHIIYGYGERLHNDIRGEKMSFRVSWKTYMYFMLISLLMVFLLKGQVDIILENFILSIPSIYMHGYAFLHFYIYVVLMMVPVSILHELVHGFTYTLFGGRVKFGFKGIYMYTREISGKPIRRVKFVIVLLMPLVFVSLLSCLLKKWGGMVFLLNLLGSSGDIVMALALMRYSYQSRVVDREYGFDVILGVKQPND